MKAKVSNQQDFFPEVDPRKRPPSRPDPADYRDEDDGTDDEDCLSCGKLFEIHTTRDIIQCALNELRGENPKG